MGYNRFRGDADLGSVGNCVDEMEICQDLHEDKLGFIINDKESIWLSRDLVEALLQILKDNGYEQ